MKRKLWLLALLAAALVTGPALAHAHGGRVHFGFAFGGPVYPAPWYPAPYYYPPAYYYPPVVVRPAPPPSYIEQNETADDYWYYCAASKAYYPYVKECPGGWQRVAPQPPRG